MWKWTTKYIYAFFPIRKFKITIYSCYLWGKEMASRGRKSCHFPFGIFWMILIWWAYTWIIFLSCPPPPSFFHYKSVSWDWQEGYKVEVFLFSHKKTKMYTKKKNLFLPFTRYSPSTNSEIFHKDLKTLRKDSLNLYKWNH